MKKKNTHQNKTKNDLHLQRVDSDVPIYLIIDIAIISVEKSRAFNLHNGILDIKPNSLSI